MPLLFTEYGIRVERLKGGMRREVERDEALGTSDRPVKQTALLISAVNRILQERMEIHYTKRIADKSL